jgi:glycosyltransferase involved in cell wall biosynthesis
MKISIITATYNSGATVEHTLQSVRQQDYADKEHIIVDGLSTDKTLEIVSGFDHVARLIREKDYGIYDAMNKGIVASSGEVVGILNSDDVYANEKVLTKVKRAFEDPNIEACYADLQYVHSQDLNKVIRVWKSGKLRSRSFYWGWMPPHPTFFVRREIYEKVGLFNTALKSAADYEMMLRILVKHKFKAQYIPEVLVKMRMGGMSNASILNRVKANREDRLAWKINGLQPYFFTLYAKPIRKISQFLIR